MTLDEIKKCVCETIDQQSEKIIAVGEEIAQHPEMGYKEINTSFIIKKMFDDLCDSTKTDIAVTGVRGSLYGKSNLANICIIGEMDAIKCRENKRADADGVCHACGHNTQVAMMLGALIGLAKSGVMENLDGNITFLGAPAEEFVDLAYRSTLKKKNKIIGYGGKQELIYENEFDDVDMAMMIHAKGSVADRKVYVRGHNLGFIAKNIVFRGKAVHGSKPFDGINALNAASLAILGIHSNRETFRDEDKIRIHPIITKGGDVVNTVPDEVRMETYVRGASNDAIKKGNDVVNRSVKGACDIIGADCEIEDIQGYLPLHEDENLSAVFEQIVKELVGEDSLVYGDEITGSTDIGDLSCIMPVIQPSIGGFAGELHSGEFEIVDKYTAYILTSKILACTACELLYNKAEKAKSVIENFVPIMTKNDYIKYLKG